MLPLRGAISDADGVWRRKSDEQLVEASAPAKKPITLASHLPGCGFRVADVPGHRPSSRPSTAADAEEIARGRESLRAPS
jgi:hypothetical protein